MASTNEASNKKRMTRTKRSSDVCLLDKLDQVVSFSKREIEREKERHVSLPTGPIASSSTDWTTMLLIKREADAANPDDFDLERSNTVSNFRKCLVRLVQSDSPSLPVGKQKQGSDLLTD
jgi:hypothetical protein